MPKACLSVSSATTSLKMCCRGWEETPNIPKQEIENNALAMALRLWSDLLADTYTVFQEALLSGTSSTAAGRKLLQKVSDIESEVVCKSWYGRVASHSNPSDLPSRGHYNHLEREGAARS